MTPPALERRRAHLLLELACLGFAGLGLLLACFGHTALFGPWRAAVGADLFGAGGIPADLGPFLRTTDAILGGSIIGKWVAAWFLVHHGVRAGRRWAWLALLAGHGTWFLLDSGRSLALGVPSNVLLINLFPGIGFLALLLWGRPGSWTPPTVSAPRPAWRWMTAACAASVGIGLGVVFAPRSPPFAVYNAALHARFGVSEAVVTWELFAYALVGATFTAQFVMLWWAAAAERGAPWVGRAVIASVLAWFCVDSVGCALQGAWFNIALVNVPSLLLVALPWWLAVRPR